MWSRLEVPKTLQQLRKAAGPMVAEAGFSHEDNVVGHLGSQGVEISDPLGQAPDFAGHVHIHQSLGFDDHH